MILDTLITDRTQEDVDYVRMLSKNGTFDPDFYNGELKGAYNARDLNRVEEAVEYVADELSQALAVLQAYAVSLNVAWDDYYGVDFDPADYTGVVVKKTWTETDVPNVTDMTRYLNNLVLIKAAYNTPVVLPTTMGGLTYVFANNIESMLLGAHQQLQADIELKKSYIRSAAECWRSGDIYSGEIGGAA